MYLVDAANFAAACAALALFSAVAGGICSGLDFFFVLLLGALLQALRLSETEEKELLAIAQQQQKLLPGMQRGRWLQAWVEPFAAGPAQQVRLCLCSHLNLPLPFFQASLLSCPRLS